MKFDVVKLTNELVSYRSESLLTNVPVTRHVIGILKDMYDTFSADLETQTEQEATSQKNYEGLMAEKAKQLATLRATLTKKEAKKA